MDKIYAQVCISQTHILETVGGKNHLCCLCENVVSHYIKLKIEFYRRLRLRVKVFTFTPSMNYDRNKFRGLTHRRKRFSSS